MAKNFNEKLIELLKTDSRFVDDEGELVKAAVIDRAWKIDRELVKLLLSKPEIKAKFFDEIEGHWIFNINTFIEYVADKNFLADSYTRFRNKIGLNIDGKFLRERGEVSLVWPYKDCVLEGGQTKEEEKRKEIFFNEILAQDEIDRLFDPKVLTFWKRYTVDGEQKVTDIKRDESGTIRENLIIKGNNLLALHTLKKQFRGKVKLIYIDPPYNTGNDSFKYNDNFNRSSWLTFIKNRLDVAKELLRKDGVIFISCDDNEHAYLKVLCDDIFGEENYLASISVISNWKGRSDDKYFATAHNYLLAYKRETFVSYGVPLPDEYLDDYPEVDDSGRYYRLIGLRKRGSGARRQDRPNMYYPIFANPKTKEVDTLKRKGFTAEIYPKLSDGSDGRWRWGKETTRSRLVELTARQVGSDSRWDVFQIDHAEFEGELKRVRPKTIWLDKAFSNEAGTLELKKIFGKKIFDNPKPSALIKYIIQQSTIDNDLILDFFAGSGTTAQAVLELNKLEKTNRKYILIEQMNYIEEIPVVRLEKIMNKNGYETEFLYFELMEYNEIYMQKILKSKSNQELLTLWKEITKNSFLNWYINPSMPEDAMNDFIEIGKTENGLEKQKKLLAELLNKNQLYVNLSEIDDEDFKVSEDDKELNQLFYWENA